MWKDEKRSFEFPIKAYFDSNFWNQTQKNLAQVGFLEPVEYEQSKHISHEKPLPERSKVLDLGKDAFQEWDKKGFINEILNFPKSIVMTKTIFNQYFRKNVDVVMVFLREGEG